MQTLKLSIREFDETTINACLDNLWAYVALKITKVARDRFEPTLAEIRHGDDVDLKYFVFCNMLCNSERELDVAEMVRAATLQPLTEEELRLLTPFFRAAYEVCQTAAKNEPVDVSAVNNKLFAAFNLSIP